MPIEKRVKQRYVNRRENGIEKKMEHMENLRIQTVRIKKLEITDI